MVTKEINLKIWEENHILVYTVKGEVDSRKLKIFFKDQNINDLDLSDKTITMYIKKPDGTQIYENCSIDGNAATVTITSQMVSVIGILECEFQIFNSNNLLLKVNGLKIVVASKGDFSEAIESTSEYNALISALNQANSYSQTAVRGIKINGNSIPYDANNVVNIVTSDNSIPIVEYGTWDPEFICAGGTNPTYTLNYTSSHYYRIGDLVYITFFIYANITDIGSGNAHIGGLPFKGHSNTDRQAISMSVKGPFSSNTALTIDDSQKYLKIGITDGSGQSWSLGNIYIGGSGCYLKA